MKCKIKIISRKKNQIYKTKKRTIKINIFIIKIIFKMTKSTLNHKNIKLQQFLKNNQNKT